MTHDMTFCTTTDCGARLSCLRKCEPVMTKDDFPWYAYAPLGRQFNDRCEYYIEIQPADAQAEKEAKR